MALRAGQRRRRRPPAWNCGRRPTSRPAANRRRRPLLRAQGRIPPHRSRDRLTMEVPSRPMMTSRSGASRCTTRASAAPRLALTSYGEVVMAAPEADHRHPAFNKLFIESEYLPELARCSSVAGRGPRARPRSSGATTWLARATALAASSYESDRAAFLGRGRSAQSPSRWPRRRGRRVAAPSRRLALATWAARPEPRSIRSCLSRSRLNCSRATTPNVVPHHRRGRARRGCWTSPAA